MTEKSPANDRSDIRLQKGPHVFVADIENPILGEEDRHHLGRVLRLDAGDPLTVSDGCGRWRPARFGKAIDPFGEVQMLAKQRPLLTIAIGLTKGTKPELVVQKTTEIGIDRVLIFEAERSVVRWDQTRRDRNLKRLRRIGREAAMQSRQVYLPEIDVIDRLEDTAGLAAMVRADFGGRGISAEDRAVVVGPEGGWSSAEREMLSTAVDLGPTVLRSETAAVVAASLLMRFWV